MGDTQCAVHVMYNGVPHYMAHPLLSCTCHFKERDTLSMRGVDNPIISGILMMPNKKKQKEAATANIEIKKQHIKRWTKQIETLEEKLLLNSQEIKPKDAELKMRAALITFRKSYDAVGQKTKMPTTTELTKLQTDAGKLGEALTYAAGEELFAYTGTDRGLAKETSVIQGDLSLLNAEKKRVEERIEELNKWVTFWEAQIELLRAVLKAP